MNTDCIHWSKTRQGDGSLVCDLCGVILEWGNHPNRPRILGLTTPTSPAPGVLVAHPGGRWRFTLVVLCGFEPYGRACPNAATVVVIVSGLDLPDALVPTCDNCLPDWKDDVAATAVSIAELTARPASTVPTGGGAR